MTEDELRRLRARVAGLEQENADLRERLAYAWPEVEYLRARLVERTGVLRTAEPGVGRTHTTLAPVTPAESWSL